MALHNLFIASTVRRQHVSKKEVMLRNRKVRFFSLAMVIVLCLALLYVWTRIQVVQLGYDVSRLTGTIKELTKQRSILEAEVAKLKSAARLETKAIQDFGMRLPSGEEVVFVEP
jgi:cell division protein FtsL